MKDIFHVFCEENWLQITDHIITILFGVASFILAIIVLKLSKKDKLKTIAINELQTQTKHLKELYLYQIQPRFTVKKHVSGWIKVINIGSDAYNVNVKANKQIKQQLIRFIDDFKDFYSSGTETELSLNNFNEYDLIFNFEDKLGNKYKQTLFVNKQKFSNLELK